MHILSDLHEENSESRVLTDRYSLAMGYLCVEKQFLNDLSPHGRLLFSQRILEPFDNLLGEVVVCFYKKLLNNVLYSVNIYLSHDLLLVLICPYRTRQKVNAIVRLPGSSLAARHLYHIV